MIPRIIHYCWFGGNPLPEMAKHCIASWKKYCPDYEIKEWNEDNFDINCCDYVSEAYKAGKWAFVSDYARLKIIYENGGVYLDTDVEAVNTLDNVLDNSFFFGIEKHEDKYHDLLLIKVATGLGFGAEAGNEVLGSMLNDYEHIHFIKEDGSFDLTTCPVRNSKSLYKYGYKDENRTQKFLGGTIYPAEYFCPKEAGRYTDNYSENTLTIHHYSGSWLPKSVRVFIPLKRCVKRFIVTHINNRKNDV